MLAGERFCSQWLFLCDHSIESEQDRLLAIHLKGGIHALDFLDCSDANAVVALKDIYLDGQDAANNIWQVRHLAITEHHCLIDFCSNFIRGPLVCITEDIDNACAARNSVLSEMASTHCQNLPVQCKMDGISDHLGHFRWMQVAMRGILSLAHD